MQWFSIFIYPVPLTGGGPVGGPVPRRDVYRMVALSDSSPQHGWEVSVCVCVGGEGVTWGSTVSEQVSVAQCGTDEDG